MYSREIRTVEDREYPGTKQALSACSTGIEHKITNTSGETNEFIFVRIYE